jgi:hypothetical protein
MCVNFLSTNAYAISFSADQRSAYHAGASAAIALPFATMLKYQQEDNGFSDVQIVAYSTAVALVPGLFKEFAMDAYPDYGDVAFDVLGGAIGAYTGTKFGAWLSVRRSGDTTIVSLAKAF